MSNELIETLLQSAYQRGYEDGVEDQSEDCAHKDAATEGYQNWLSDNPEAAEIADRVVVKGSAEPVAWLYEGATSGLKVSLTRLPHLVDQGWTEIPLYAHPQKVDLAGVDEPVSSLKPPHVWFWFVPSPEMDATNIRKWSHAPFDGGIEYVPATALQSLAAQLAEAREENERLTEQVRRFDNAASLFYQLRTTIMVRFDGLKSADSALWRSINAAFDKLEAARTALKGSQQ